MELQDIADQLEAATTQKPTEEKGGTLYLSGMSINNNRCSSLFHIPLATSGLDEYHTTFKPLSKAELRKEKLRAWKNIAVLDLLVFLYFSPMMTYTNIMSSINSDQGMGLASESINGGFLLVGSILLCPYITRRWSPKTSLFAAAIVAIPYLLINFYVTWVTIIVGSVLAGIGDCLVHQAVGVYLSDIAQHYSKLFGNDRESFLLRLFGLLGTVIQCSFIVGNLLVWGVLDMGHYRTNGHHDPKANNVTLQTLDHIEFCGASFCHQPFNGTELVPRPDQGQLFTLCGIFTGMGLAGILSLLFLDDYSQVQVDPPKFPAVVKDTMTLFKEPPQLMLMMLSVLNGLYEGFFFGDYTEAYVSCSIDVAEVGLVMMCFGIAHGMFAVCQETLDNWFGRLPIMLFGGSLLSALVLALLFWQPHPRQLVIYYLLAALYGIADAVLATHISTLFGTIFEDKPQEAYSWQTFSYGVGLCISFGYSYYLCTSVKLYILGVAIALGMMSYVSLETYLQRMQSDNKHTLSNGNNRDINQRFNVTVGQARLIRESR